MGASLQGQRVLVVEDEPFIALDMEAILTSAGAHVITMHHLQGAFEAAREGDITAAVLDVDLGEGDCSALCEVLAQRNVPFIFHTGYVDGGPIDQWRRPVVAKPATQQELLQCLAGALVGPTLACSCNPDRPHYRGLRDCSYDHSSAAASSPLTEGCADEAHSRYHCAVNTAACAAAKLGVLVHTTRASLTRCCRANQRRHPDVPSGD